MLNLRAVVRAADRTICVSQAEHDELARSSGRPRRSGRRHSQRRSHPASARRERRGSRPRRARDRRGRHRRDLGRLARRAQGSARRRSARRNEAGLTLLVVGDGPLRSRASSASRGAERARPRASATTCRACSRRRTSSSRPRTARASPSRCSRRWLPGSRRSSPISPRTSRRSATTGVTCPSAMTRRLVGARPLGRERATSVETARTRRARRALGLFTVARRWRRPYREPSTTRCCHGNATEATRAAHLDGPPEYAGSARNPISRSTRPGRHRSGAAGRRPPSSPRSASGAATVSRERRHVRKRHERLREQRADARHGCEERPSAEGGSRAPTRRICARVPIDGR